MDLLRSLGVAKSVVSKVGFEAAEIILGRRVAKAKRRAAERAKIAVRIAAPLMKRGRDGVTPFAHVRARAALRAVRGKPHRQAQGAR